MAWSSCAELTMLQKTPAHGCIMNCAILSSTRQRTHLSLGFTIATILVASTASNDSVALSGLIPGHTNNYAECVIRQLHPNTGTQQVDAIVGQCRTAFPDISRRNMLDARSVQNCYQRYQDRIANRPAAKALFVACQDYFRQSQATLQ
jgi:hypothetical protein